MGEGKQGPQDYINKVREGVNWENNQINKACYKIIYYYLQ